MLLSEARFIAEEEYEDILNNGPRLPDGKSLGKLDDDAIHTWQSQISREDWVEHRANEILENCGESVEEEKKPLFTFLFLGTLSVLWIIIKIIFSTIWFIIVAGFRGFGKGGKGNNYQYKTPKIYSSSKRSSGSNSYQSPSFRMKKWRNVRICGLHQNLNPGKVKSSKRSKGAESYMVFAPPKTNRNMTGINKTRSIKSGITYTRTKSLWTGKTAYSRSYSAGPNKRVSIGFKNGKTFKRIRIYNPFARK